jgi:hypothetical protein
MPASAAALAWTGKVRERARSIAIESGQLSPDQYAEILSYRAALFGDLPGPIAAARRGPKRRRPALAPAEALTRYTEILHSLWNGVTQ